MTEKIMVLLVEDHAVVRQGVRAFLDTQPDMIVVGEAESGKTAVALVTEFLPDVVLMDLIMPGMDGVEATRRMKQISPHTQIIILTSYHDDEHIFPAIRAGALSYVLKDIGPEALGNVVHKAANGEAVLNPQVATRLVQEFHGAHEIAPNPFIELTLREMEVLRLIAGGRRNVDIARELVISEKTVKNHVSNILSKLHLADRTQAAVYAWREGIVRRYS
ncbi:MAG: response regulator transcription factor [Candidatus Promineifilaceae bacterium]